MLINSMAIISNLIYLVGYFINLVSLTLTTFTILMVFYKTKLNFINNHIMQVFFLKTRTFMIQQKGINSDNYWLMESKNWIQTLAVSTCIYFTLKPLRKTRFHLLQLDGKTEHLKSFSSVRISILDIGCHLTL